MRGYAGMQVAQDMASMGARRTYLLESGYVSAKNDEADERWREVFFALLQRANLDAEFRARVEASGAVIRDFEAVLAGNRVPHALPSGAITVSEYWWGFQIEIPHGVLSDWAATMAHCEPIADAIGTGVGPSGPFRRRVATWIAGRLIELQHLDRGAGVYVNMTWMAPNIFIPIAVPTP